MWIGEFSEGKMHGSGTLTFKNGEKFEGEFHDGIVNGEGTFHSNHGFKIIGNWEQGHTKSFKKEKAWLIIDIFSG